jgi:hypothetical protein
VRDAIHADWTKLRTVPGTGGLLLAATALTVAAAFSIVKFAVL